MKTKGYLLQALSPLHAGTGQAVDIIELPIARMRSTGIPFVPGSSVKGVLREHCDAQYRETVFGPSRAEGDDPKDLDYASALVVSDARLLALPVRSFRGTFCFASSPMLLHLWKRDLEFNTSAAPSVPAIHGNSPQAWYAKGNINLMNNGKTGTQTSQKIYLEDLDFHAQESTAVQEWANYINTWLPQDERELFGKRFVLLDDESMGFLWETATQIDTRIRINQKTGTVAKGALWTEESLPSETLLVGMITAYPSRRPGIEMGAEKVLSHALHQTEFLQFGGKATVGRGRCRILPMQGAAS